MAELTSTDTLEKGGAEGHKYTNGSIHPLNRPESKSFKHGLSTCLRLLTFGATVAAFIVMVTNKQTILLPSSRRYGITAEFQSLSAFVWFAIATAIVFVYSIVAIIVETCIVSKNNSSYLLWAIFGLDLIMTNILMSACAACLAVELVGQKGNSQAQWRAFCTDFDGFCDHVTGALVAGAIGFAGLAEICILDAYHLYTQYTRY